MGFIINKPIDDIQLSDIIKIEKSNKNLAIQKKHTVFFGGPVEFKSGFITFN